ncbi:CPSF A subunit region-domain-containing protein [Multifurca ochricompacta]|uniref:CPSF A subunit region-domain-containing protein n=1 Tax=Multifurca ochricompacta TaxID=376703 RepID=A0AAD4M9F8_9AGAM|nr:CPSF A subunit region-domain-containing protein [Multifurca ochricompacta]
MRIVSTFHQPSSVTDAIKCHLTSDTFLIHLVVAKSNRLDIYSVQQNGLRYECGTEIWGRIVVVRAIPTQGGKSNLLLLTDHPDPRLIFFSYSTPSLGGAFLNTLKTLSLHHHNARPSEFLHSILVDPSGRVAIVNCYTGKIRVVELDNGLYKNDFDVMVSELNILSLAFLSASAISHNYSLAILHLDYNQNIQLLARDLILSECELSSTPSLLLPQTVLSSSVVTLTEAPPCLVTIPSQKSNETGDPLPGGILVLGGRKIQFFELSSEEWQEKFRGKQRKLESRKKSIDQVVAAKAKEKQKELEVKKRKAKAAVEWPWYEVTAWSPANEEGTRFFVGDSYGSLALLSLGSTAERGLVVIPLGEVSPPTALAYLDSQVLFIGSHFADSQLIRIHTSPISDVGSPTLPIPADILTVPLGLFSSSGKGKGRASMTDKEGSSRVLALNGTYIEVLDTWQNVGPILDAVLADTDGSGQPRIVTASGGINAGSLRIIQNGADFQTVAVIEDTGTFSKIFPVRHHFHDSHDTHILATNSQETVLLSLDLPDRLSAVPAQNMGFDPSPTLAASNVARRLKNITGRTLYEDSSLVVQVTERKVLLLEYDDVLQVHSVLTSWAPDEQGGEWEGRKIIAAALNPSQFVLGLSRKRLVLLNLDENNKFQIFRYKDLREEISALSCTPLNTAKMFSLYIAVAFWSIHAVDLLSVASTDGYFEPVCNSVSLPALPRSLLLHDFGNAPQMLVGLRDGTLVAYAFMKNQFEDKRVFSLGTEPVVLTQFEMGEKNVVFANGSRAALFYLEKGTLQHSSVLIKNVFASAKINSPNWPSSLLLMTSSGCIIGTVQDLDKMHIRTIPLGPENPRRLEYDRSLHAFAVACVRSEPARIGENEYSTSSLKLLDDKTFDVLSQFTCQSSEEVTTIQMIPLSEEDTAVICVGTVFFKPGEKEPSQGRLLLFSAEWDSTLLNPKRQLKKISDMSVNGCVYALTRVNQLLAASIGPTVVLYKVDSTGFQAAANWSHNYLVTSLVGRGSRLFIGDAICSVSVIDIFENEGGEVRLESVAKDFSPLWPVSIESLDQDTIIGANSDCNLFTHTVQRGETRTFLDRNGLYNLGDVVNKFIPGSMTSSDSVPSDIALVPKLFFFTSSGRIGVIIDVGSELSLHLTALERNLGRVVTEIANVSHAKHRTPAGAWERSDADLAAYGFLDGDFLEKFLDYEQPSAEVERVLRGSSPPERLKQTYGEIKQTLEALQALH